MRKKLKESSEFSSLSDYQLKEIIPGGGRDKTQVGEVFDHLCKWLDNHQEFKSVESSVVATSSVEGTMVVSQDSNPTDETN